MKSKDKFGITEFFQLVTFILLFYVVVIATYQRKKEVLSQANKEVPSLILRELASNDD